MSLKRSFVIGLMCGLRSQMPPAVTAWRLADKADYLPLPFCLIGTRPLRLTQTVLMGLELVGDKLPITPSRTERRGVIARVVAGGGTGACVAPAGMQAGGFIAGVAGALIGTYGGHALRVRLPKMLAVPDFAVALVEDAVAITGSLLVTYGVPETDDLAYRTE